MIPAFVVTVALCAGTDCTTESVTFRPSVADVVAEWCDRYARSKAAQLARSYVPRRELVVQSMTCAEVG